MRTLRDELAASFDRVFSEPYPAQVAETLRYIDVRVGSESYAVLADDLVGLQKFQKVTRVFGQEASLYGLAAVHAQLFAIYSLAILLELRTEHAEEDRFILLPKTAPDIGLAFSSIAGIELARPADFIEVPDARAYVRGFLKLQNETKRVLDLPLILSRMTKETFYG